MSLLNSDNGAGAAGCVFELAHRLDGDLYHPRTAADCWSVSFANGPEKYFGSGRPSFTIEVPDERFWRNIQRKGAYAAALAFVKGQIEIEGDIVEATRWWSARQHVGLADWLATVSSLFSFSPLDSVFQSRRRATRNIHFHYDRLVEFYKCFLDEHLVYSCGYFHQPSDSLDHAQISKLEHICRKLELEPGDRFLDIGSGWGALPLHAAKRHRVNAAGCTLSDRQYEFDQERVIKEGWASNVRILQSDYRDLNDKFTKIASIGMFEHVGRRRLPQYFRRVSELLEEDGLFLNHGIIRPQKVHDGPETAFLRKHVFPGGELAHLSEVVLAAEEAGFEIVDLENLRPHYALTCRAWVSRLQLSREVALKLVTPETYRTWLLFLAASSASFDVGHTDVYQLLMSKRGSRRNRHLTRMHIHGFVNH